MENLVRFAEVAEEIPVSESDRDTPDVLQEMSRKDRLRKKRRAQFAVPS